MVGAVRGRAALHDLADRFAGQIPVRAMLSRAQRSTTAPMMAAVSSTPWFMNAIGIGVGLALINWQMVWTSSVVVAMF